MNIRMRHTRAHTGNRRSHHAISNVSLVHCEDCGAWKQRHRVCMECGKYRGRVMVDVVAKIGKKLAKNQSN